MYVKRAPRPALRAFIKSIWLVDETAERRSAGVEREHVLPTGEMHLVFRLSEQPVRLFAGPLDKDGETFGTTVIGGTRAAYYLKDVTAPGCSAGVQLQPGAAHPLPPLHFSRSDLLNRVPYIPAVAEWIEDTA